MPCPQEFTKSELGANKKPKKRPRQGSGKGGGGGGKIKKRGGTKLLGDFDEKEGAPSPHSTLGNRTEKRGSC